MKERIPYWYKISGLLAIAWLAACSPAAATERIVRIPSATPVEPSRTPFPALTNTPTPTLTITPSLPPTDIPTHTPTPTYPWPPEPTYVSETQVYETGRELIRQTADAMDSQELRQAYESLPENLQRASVKVTKEIYQFGWSTATVIDYIRHQDGSYTGIGIGSRHFFTDDNGRPLAKIGLGLPYEGTMTEYVQNKFTLLHSPTADYTIFTFSGYGEPPTGAIGRDNLVFNQQFKRGDKLSLLGYGEGTENTKGMMPVVETMVTTKINGMEVYVLLTPVSAGFSGAGVVDPDGKLVGHIFAYLPPGVCMVLTDETRELINQAFTQASQIQ